jgi:hypothetical protein
MDNKYRFSKAIIAALLFTGASACLSQADEKPAVSASEKQISPKNEISLSAADRTKLNIHLDDSYVIDALRKISDLGKIDIIMRGHVHPKVKLWNIKMDNVYPEDAVERICAAAKLSWENHNDVYIIGKNSPASTVEKDSPSAAVKQSKKPITLEFTDIPTAQILAAIGESNGIYVSLGSTIIDGEKINFIRLNNMTPENVLEEIAYAFDFELKKLRDDIYVIKASAITSQDFAQIRQAAQQERQG